MTHSLIIVQLVTLLFRVSTALTVPLLVVVAVRSNLLFSNFIITVLAGPGFTVTGILIGSIPGMFIVITSFPALKLGYKVMFNLPSVVMKSFALLNMICFLFSMIFSFTVHRLSNPSLLVMFATVFNMLLFLSVTLMTRLAMFSGLICAMPSVSIYWISASSFGSV